MRQAKALPVLRPSNPFCLSKWFHELPHSDPKVANSHSKIFEDFLNYFWKTVARSKCVEVLKCKFRDLKVDTIFKIHATFYSSLDQCDYVTVIQAAMNISHQFSRQGWLWSDAMTWLFELSCFREPENCGIGRRH